MVVAHVYYRLSLDFDKPEERHIYNITSGYAKPDEDTTLKKSWLGKYWKIVSYESVDAENDESMEGLFAQYNDDGYGGKKNPLATPAGQAHIRSLGVRHTSMSVGDIIRFGKNFYIVADHGFKKIAWRGA